MVNIDLSGIANVNGTLNIIDIMGRVVKSATCTATHQELQTADLATGVYTVLFVGADGNKLQARLMIVK